MIIKELYIAEFGGIKDKKIELSRDNMLSVIYGENESGKSTIFLFIKFMLYGLQRKSQSNTERERSLSWSGSTASGSLTLEYNGKDFRIERSFSDRARGEKLVILSLDSGAPISTDKTPGEYFLGVPREVFESSACVGQMRSSEINGEKTAQSLSNMLSSADEGVDTSAVLKELNTIRASYMHKNQGGGTLFEDEAKINSLQMKLEEAKNASIAIEGKSESFDNIKKEYEALKLDLEAKDALVSQFNKIGIIRRFEALRKKESELSQVVGKKEACAEEALATEYFPDRIHIAELRAAARELAEREETIEQRAKRIEEHKPSFDAELAALGERAEKSGGRDTILAPFDTTIVKVFSRARLSAIFGGSAIITAILAVVGFIFIHMIFGFVSLGITLGLDVATIILVISALSLKKKYNKTLNEVAEIFKTTPEGLGDKIDLTIAELEKMRKYDAEHLRLASELDLAEEALEGTKKRVYELLRLTIGGDAEPDCITLKKEAVRLQEFLDKYDELAREEDAFLRMLENERNLLSKYDEEKLRGEITVNIEEATAEAVAEAERTKSFLLAKKNAYEGKIALLQNELIALRIKAEDPMPIADRLAALQAKNKRDREFYDALLLAMNVIEESSSAMRGNVTPIISKNASELMARMSNDKYNVLRTNSRLGLMLDKDGFAIGSELLSAGTKDIAYIALRIALIMQIYANEHAPIIFDESFCQLDDNRLKMVIELLCSLTKENIQIILFTSHKREAEACRNIDFKFNEINL